MNTQKTIQKNCRTRNIVRSFLINSVLVVYAGTITAATFHVDPVNGDDTAAGTLEAPWKSPAKAWEACSITGTAKAAAGDVTVELKGGNYGRFSLSGTAEQTQAASRPRITYKAAPGESPVFSGMSFIYDEPTALNLRFDGITVRPGTETALSKTATVAGGPVELEGVSNVEYINSSFMGTTWQSSIACVRLTNCRNLLFDHCEVGNGGSGYTINGCQDFTIRYNHIHALSSSGIKYMVGNKNAVLEYNHIHDQQTWNDSHASAISVRSGDATIRGNIMHDGWTSSCIMFYLDDMGNTYVYNNITVEDNVMYDITNGYYVFRIYNLGTNVTIRNNTIFEPLKTSLIIHSLASGYNGSGLRLCNNLIVGATTGVPATATVQNNIFSKYNNSLTTAPASNVIYAAPAYFINVFFADKPLITSNHGQTLDFSLATASPAIGFGNPATQSAVGTGTVGSDGFIRKNGVTRNASHHSAGAYETEQTAYIRNVRMEPSGPQAAGTELYSIRGGRIGLGSTLPTGVYLGVNESGIPVKKILVR